MEKITGKVALITGAGKGIGRSIALALANEGVKVALLSRTMNDLTKVAEEIAAQGGTAYTVTADVSDFNAMQTAVKQVESELGAIDILINNAGVGIFGGFLEVSPEDFKKVLEINLFGVYNATHAVLPSMIERKTGDIINVSSTAGLKGAAITSAYSASKFAVNGLSESLMLEVRKHNIRVSTLCPSTVATDLAMDLKLTDGNPEKVMQPEDLAELVVMQLKLNRRVFIKEAGMWSTNP